MVLHNRHRALRDRGGFVHLLPHSRAARNQSDFPGGVSRQPGDRPGDPVQPAHRRGLSQRRHLCPSLRSRWPWWRRTAAAGVVTPVMLTWAISGIYAAPMVVRFGFRKTSLMGATLIFIGFSGLLTCSLLESPRWLITTVLAITGLGFGPCSMSYLLAARMPSPGSSVASPRAAYSSFARSAARSASACSEPFNVLVRPDLARLETQYGVKPAALLDPNLHKTLSPDVSAIGTTFDFVQLEMGLCGDGAFRDRADTCSRRSCPPSTASVVARHRGRRWKRWDDSSRVCFSTPIR